MSHLIIAGVFILIAWSINWGIPRTVNIQYKPEIVTKGGS